MSGKGSAPRPFSVDQKTFGDNWDRIFKKDKQETFDDRMWKKSLENMKENWDHYNDLPSPNYYQDILSTEDCVIDALDLEDPDRVGN